MTNVELEIALNAIAATEGGPMFVSRPDRWYEDPHWRCPKGHISTRYLKSEERGGAVCPRGTSSGPCKEFVQLTFPEDKDGPLPAATVKL